MGWLLLFCAFGAYAPGCTSAGPFESETACQAAAKLAKQELQPFGTTFRAVCVQQGGGPRGEPETGDQ